MSREQVKKAVETAFSNAKKVKTQERSECGVRSVELLTLGRGLPLTSYLVLRTCYLVRVCMSCRLLRIIHAC